MILLKDKKDIEILKEGGRRHAVILNELALMVKEGMSSLELEKHSLELIEKNEGISPFLNYKPKGAKRSFPASLCVSVNDEIVHGIPNENPKILREGDIVSLDLGFKYKGLITDSAITVGVGKISSEAKKLIDITKKSMQRGIAAAQKGNTLGDIGYEIESFVRNNSDFSLAQGLAGHGVGFQVHEDPFVPNYGQRGKGLELSEGMVLAIEPMINIGTGDIVLSDDNFAYRTKDGKISAHFEHTIAISDEGTIVLTQKI